MGEERAKGPRHRDTRPNYVLKWVYCGSCHVSWKTELSREWRLRHRLCPGCGGRVRLLSDRRSLSNIKRRGKPRFIGLPISGEAPLPPQGTTERGHE